MPRPRKSDEDRLVREKPLSLYLTAAEIEAVQRAIKRSGMTQSAFLRAAVMGRRIPTASVLDLDAVRTLAQVNRDQAALTRLLSLTRDSNVCAYLLNQISDVQARLVAAAKAIKT